MPRTKKVKEYYKLTKPPKNFIQGDMLDISDEDMHELASECVECGLCETRTRTVWSRGEGRKGLLIIGEAPGQNEDELGLPFIGNSGQLLEKILFSVGLDSQRDCKIINVVKCRPPENRNPSAKEIDSCRKYLLHQILTYNPKLILTIGSIPTSTIRVLFGLRIVKERGNISYIYIYVGREDKTDIHVYPTVSMFHPAYLLRNPSLEPGSAKWLTWQDMISASSMLK